MESISTFSKRVHDLLRRTGLTLATAESCTGGWIAKLITDRSGASNVFNGGLVVYSNAVKRTVLGVRISDEESAVRKEVAESMAKRALVMFKSDLAVATTGYMEPSDELEREFKRKRITGMAFIAVAAQHGALVIIESKRLFFKGTRRQNRLSASTAALHLVVKIIKEIRRQ